jgi:indolepyruvate ferredoxin oxidoreductase
MNLKAFALGRRAAHDPAALAAFLGGAAKAPTAARHISVSLDEMIERRVAHLTGYQNAAYAARYAALVQKVRAEEERVLPGSTKLAEAVARYGFKLMAYKDEYEVARLYVLAKLRFLRGGAFDIFGRTEERRTERALIGEYETLVRDLVAKLDRGNVGLAVELASIPEEIRGYGHVKERHLAAAKKKEAALVARWTNATVAKAA